FSELYGRHNQRLFNYCATILLDTEAAKDITHALWEKIIGLRSTLRDVTNPAGFFFKTARNLCFDHLKHLKYQTTIEGLPEAMHPVSQKNELTEEEELVVLALEKLPIETREILILTYYSGYSAEEIADMLGKKPNAIWTRISRARKELKVIIESEMRKSRRNTYGT
ncbi:MAG: RNA polymerase sigma factor, partial [Ignavibacteriota bacterium]